VSFFRGRPPRSADAYLRFIPRTEMDIAVVGVGVSLTGHPARSPRPGFRWGGRREGVAAPGRPGDHREHLDQAAQDRLAAAARAACRPIDDKRGTVEFRVEVAGVLARRAAVIARERARNA
jgi:carbon-monoxide dehydrogenase medium subunit